MAYGPPRDPKEGDSWRSGRDVFRFQAGKGWVDERLYQPLLPEGAGNEPEPDPEPVVLEARPGSFIAENPAIVPPPFVLQVAERQTVDPLPDLQPVALKQPPRGQCACGAQIGWDSQRCRPCHRAAQKARAKPKPTEVNRCACGKVIGLESKRCRPCFAAERKGSAKPKEQPTCSDCGKPRSVGSGQRCRPCWTIWHAAQKPAPKPAPTPAPPKFKPDPAEAERVRRAAARLEEERAHRKATHAQSPRAVPEARPPEPKPTFHTGGYVRADATPPVIVDRSYPAPPKRRAEETVEVRAPGFKPAPDPRQHRERKAKEPEFSEEFMAKLAAMKPTDRLVVVQPIRKTYAGLGGGGSSLSEIT